MPHETGHAAAPDDAASRAAQPSAAVTLHLAAMLAGLAILELLLKLFAGPRPPMDNLEFWESVAQTMRMEGFFNVWTPYPPVFPTLFYAVYSLLPTDWIDPLWQAVNALLIAAQAGLVYVLVRESLPAGSPRAGTMAALSGCAYALAVFRPSGRVLLGPWMDQFDYLPATLLLLGLWLLVRRRLTASAVVCGVGVMTKLFPGLLVVLALPVLGWRSGLRYAAIAAAVCAVIAAPFVAANRAAFMSTWRWTADRGAWESVWAYAMPGRGVRDPLANMPDDPRAEMARPYRPQPGLNRVNVVTLVPLAVTLAAAGLLMMGRTAPLDLCRGLLVMLLALMAFNKGFSSYYIVWAIPLVCVVYRGATGFLIGAALVLLSNTELVGFMGRWMGAGGDEAAAAFFGRLGPPYFLFWASIFYREMILLAVAVHQVLRLRRSREFAA